MRDILRKVDNLKAEEHKNKYEIVTNRLSYNY